MSLHNIAFLTLKLWDRATSPNTKLCVHPLYIQRNPVNLTLGRNRKSGKELLLFGIAYFSANIYICIYFDHC